MAEEGIERVEPPASFESVDDLHAFLERFVDHHNRLVREFNDLHTDLDALHAHIELITATTPTQQQGKQAKLRAILDYATTTSARGPAGVSLTTGEVAAAAGCSRDTALRLMDEIAGSVDWATLKNPGGPRSKRLRIALPALTDWRTNPPQEVDDGN